MQVNIAAFCGALSHGFSKGDISAGSQSFEQERRCSYRCAICGAGVLPKAEALAGRPVSRVFRTSQGVASGEEVAAYGLLLAVGRKIHSALAIAERRAGFTHGATTYYWSADGTAVVHQKTHGDTYLTQEMHTRTYFRLTQIGRAHV